MSMRSPTNHLIVKQLFASLFTVKRMRIEPNAYRSESRYPGKHCLLLTLSAILTACTAPARSC
eukprot:scaffold262258_cov34-Prasinocladus_malaysianus.AAC.1